MHPNTLEKDIIGQCQRLDTFTWFGHTVAISPHDNSLELSSGAAQESGVLSYPSFPSLQLL